MTRSADGQVRPQGAAASAPRSPDWRARRAPQGARPSPAPPNLRPKTIRLYSYLFRLHIAPHFEGQTIAEINDAQVRRWRKKLLDSGLSTVTTAKAYRLLKAIFNTAVDDGIIRRNPCRIKGAGQEECAERPTLTISEVYALADAIHPRYTVRSSCWPSSPACVGPSWPRSAP